MCNELHAAPPPRTHHVQRAVQAPAHRLGAPRHELEPVRPPVSYRNGYSCGSTRHIPDLVHRPWREEAEEEGGGRRRKRRRKEERGGKRRSRRRRSAQRSKERGGRKESSRKSCKFFRNKVPLLLAQHTHDRNDR
jgi:hypothetical protein